MSYKIKKGTWSDGKYVEEFSLKSFHTYEKAIPSAKKAEKIFPKSKIMIVPWGKIK